MNVVVRQEPHQDREAIRKVNRSAFGGDDEANLVDALREGGFGGCSRMQTTTV